jgi:HSP20 family protein
MRMVKYRPLLTDRMMMPPLGDTAARFSRMFEQMLDPGAFGNGAAWTPVIDISDRDDELVLTAELPGMTKEDVQMDIADGVFTLKGEKKEQSEEKSERFQVLERSFGTFERSFTLPRAVDASKVNATFRDGLLVVHMPKTAESNGRKFEISG